MVGPRHIILLLVLACFLTFDLRLMPQYTMHSMIDFHSTCRYLRLCIRFLLYYRIILNPILLAWQSCIEHLLDQFHQ